MGEILIDAGMQLINVTRRVMLSSEEMLVAEISTPSLSSVISRAIQVNPAYSLFSFPFFLVIQFFSVLCFTLLCCDWSNVNLDSPNQGLLVKRAKNHPIPNLTPFQNRGGRRRIRVPEALIRKDSDRKWKLSLKFKVLR